MLPSANMPGNTPCPNSSIACGIEDMPQSAGDLLRPQGRVGGQRFIVVRVALYVGGIHSIQRVVQAVWVLVDFIDRVEYHAIGEFPAKVIFIADGQIYEIVHTLAFMFVPPVRIRA